MGELKDSTKEDELGLRNEDSVSDNSVTLTDPKKAQIDSGGLTGAPETGSSRSNPSLNTTTQPESADSKTFSQAGKILEPGEMIAHYYKVISVLGTGGNSVVYKTCHVLLDKTVAIKVLLPDRIPNDKAIRRFQQEAQAVSRLEHPNIVKLNEFGVDDSGQPYLVMSYVDGVPLSTLIEQSGRLASDRAIKLVSDAADALRHAHGEGIVHRDIKPSNIIVTQSVDGSESVKIVDFGIAKIEIQGEAHATLTETGEVFGSPAYMSPEQCLGQPTDARSDIYSLGCVLYECVMGKAPFPENSALETLMSHIQKPVTFDHEIAIGGLKSVITGCLAKRASDRYQSVAELKSDLERVQSGIPPQRKPKPKASLPVRSLSAATILGLGVLLGLALINHFNTPPVVAPPGDYYGGATPADFAPGAIKPHIAKPLGTTFGDAYSEADSMDRSSMLYFQKGDFNHAIQMLEFCRDTYKEGGTHYDKEGNIETAYRAQACQHLGQCYVALNKLDKAAENYKEALQLYTKVTTATIPMYGEAVSGYAAVLQQLGRNSDAASIMRQFQTTGKITNVP